jgi:drug/metabolite transporter (DMT)-like permease
MSGVTFGDVVSTQSSATLAMLGAVLLWSSATPTMKFALAEIAAGVFVFLRLALAAFALWLLVLVTRTPARLWDVGWRPVGCTFCRTTPQATLQSGV